MNQQATGAGGLSTPGSSEQLEDSFALALRDAAMLRDLTPAALPRVGELVDGKYRIEALLAAGGMGAVFRAIHSVSGKVVALKWLLPHVDRCAERFVREARAAARIEHPNVVDVYDLGTHRGGHYLVMELLRGRSLRERLRAGRLSPTELVRIMVPLLRGVAAAHARGVIHRDLKPDNLFLCEAPDRTTREPKVLDFGIAKLRTSQGDTEQLTRTGGRVGTPAYMSPEQLIDPGSVDERTDIYAAGVIMYEALTGRLPFASARGACLTAGALALEPLPLRRLQRDVPAELERVILRALAGSPSDRHPSVGALIDDLLGALDPPRARRVPPQRTHRRVAAAAVVLLALGLITKLVLRSRQGADPTPRTHVTGPATEPRPQQDRATALRAFEPVEDQQCSATAAEGASSPSSATCESPERAKGGDDRQESAFSAATRRAPRVARDRVAPRPNVRQSSITPRAGRILRSDL